MRKSELITILLLFTFSFLIRVICLDKYPPGFYTDESAIGYSAYSILKTGRDEFGNFLPLAFKSFNDFKAPIYIYSVVPSILIFGLNEFAVRFPSALISSLTIVIVYLLTKELFLKNHSNDKTLPLISAVLVSLSPWHLTFSRIAFEGNMSLFFTTLGIYLFLLGIKKSRLFTLSLISFSLAIYSYHSARLIVPLFLIGLLIFYRQEILKKIKFLLAAGFISLIFSLPLIYTTLTNFEDVVKRPANVSIFKDKGVEGKLWEAHVFDKNQSIFLTRLLHNKPYYYLLSFLKNYSTHFSGGYLFLFGDLGEHFRVPNSGGLYLVSFPFLFFGLISLIRNKEKSGKIVLLWLILAPIAAALTFMVPSGHRNLNAIIPLLIITAYGILSWATSVERKLLVYLLFIINIGFFAYQYLVVAPDKMVKDWNYGYHQAVDFVAKIDHRYDQVIFSDDCGESYMHYLFFKPYPPDLFQDKARFDEIDKFGIGHIFQVDKYRFRKIDWLKEKKEPRILWVGTAEEIPIDDKNLNYLKIINYPNKKIAFLIVDLKIKGQEGKIESKKSSSFKLIYSWGECSDLKERYVLTLADDRKINYQEIYGGKTIKELKSIISEKEKTKIIKLIPRDFFDIANKSNRVLTNETSNFCSDLTLSNNNKEAKVKMRGKTVVELDQLMVFLSEITLKEFKTNF